MRKWLPLLVTVALLGAALFVIVPGAQAKFANCHNFGCVNKKLNALHKQQQKVQKEVFRCEKVVPLTSYYGYQYGPSGELTTALDFTALGGGTPDAFFVVETCGGGKLKQLSVPNAVQHKR
jgi:hypothetical protein